MLILIIMAFRKKGDWYIQPQTVEWTDKHDILLNFCWYLGLLSGSYGALLYCAALRCCRTPFILFVFAYLDLGHEGSCFSREAQIVLASSFFPRLQRWASHPHREMWSLQHVPGQPWALLLHGTPLINCSTLLLLHTFRAPPPAGHCRGTYLYMFIRSVKNINTPSGFDEGDCSSLSRTLPHWQTDTLGQPQGGVCHEVRNNQSISVWFIIPWTPDIDMDW